MYLHRIIPATLAATALAGALLAAAPAGAATTARSAPAASVGGYITNGHYYGRTYGCGSAGQGVKDIQALLDYATGAGLVTDGLYGPATTMQVVHFQFVSGYLRVDGTVGPATWNALCSVRPWGRYGAALNAAINAGC